MSDVVTGARLEADASGYIKSVGDIKRELKLAQQEVISLSARFGDTSKEAAAAAKKAADLKDQIGDAKSLVDAFNPDTKFRAFGASINTVVGGFTALTGAMGLLGVESELVQKTLLKVQSALALSQGISQLQEGMQSIKNLGTVLMNSLGKSGVFGLAAAGVAAVGLALAGVFTKRQSEDAKAYNSTLKDFSNAAAEAKKKVNEVGNAFLQAKNGIISKEAALKTYNTVLGDTMGKTDSLNEAEKRLAQNAETYVKITGWKAQANAMLAISAQKSAELTITYMDVEKAKGTNLYDGMKAILDKRKLEIDAIEKRANDMMLGISILSKRFGIGETKTTETKTPGTGKATTPGGKEKEIENKEIGLLQQERIDRERAANAELLREKDVNAKAAIGIETALNTQIIAGLKQVTATKEQETLAQIAIDEAKHQNDLTMAQASADILSGLSALLGEQTAAGKVLAVAAATINTYLAINKTLAAFAGLPVPGYAIAQAIATGIFGLVQVKKILSVQVPGKSSGGSVPSVGSVPAPLTASLPSSTNTRLDRDQLNQIGNAAVRAFVVESDITTSQTRIRQLNRAARI